MSFETFLGRLKVTVTPEGHINELSWAIIPTYMHGFQNNFAQVFSLKLEVPFETFVHARTLIPLLPLPPPPPHAKKRRKKERFLSDKDSL